MEPIYSGKVREIYDISAKHLIIVTTDRISAFDHILPMPIKGKGVILNGNPNPPAMLGRPEENVLGVLK